MLLLTTRRLSSHFKFVAIHAARFSSFAAMTNPTDTQSAEAKHKADWATLTNKDGAFDRKPSTFRNTIAKGGQFPPEKGRYHLYVSLACPWAHRTLIARKLKGLEEFVGVSVAHPYLGALGWSFYPPVRDEDGGYPATTGEIGTDDGLAGVTRDPQYDSKFVRELYFRANPDYTGRFTVPVLWDRVAETIVNNESSEIVRIFNDAFNDQLPSAFAKVDLYPADLRGAIDELNEWVYNDVNNGVYKAGFATKQKAYEDAIGPLFAGLDKLEKRLEGKAYLVGDQLTEADIRLYTTIVRFDVAYAGAFKCNLRTIRHDYPNLNRWLKQLYWNNEAFKETTSFEHIKEGYYKASVQVNPTRVVPVGPIPNVETL